MSKTVRSWRELTLVLWCIILLTLLFARVIHLQVFAHQEFVDLAEQNRYFHQLLPASRGLLMDRYNQPLVWNTVRYQAMANPDRVYSPVTPLSREEALALMASDSSKVLFQDQRKYRYPSLANSVGYVGLATAEELQADSDLKVGQITGKAGLEWKYEDLLRGIPGEQIFEVDALGNKLRAVQEKPSVNGKNIQTTFDPYLNELAKKALGTHRGSVVVLDAANGEVLAMTSQPSFDPNIFSQLPASESAELERREHVRNILTDPQKPLFNRAIAGAYPPGSVFKLITALAGLETGKVQPDTTVIDEGILKVGEFEYGNWYYRQYGRVEGAINLTRSIARSNDIFFYKLAEWVGPSDLARVAREYTLGRKTGIDLPSETAGLVPDPDWKLKTKGERWFLGNTYHFGIGQGDLLTSPIQIAQMIQAIANEGLLCQVRTTQELKPECSQTPTSANDREMVLQGMIQACSPAGTAFPFFEYNQERIGDDPTAIGNVKEQLNRGAVACKTGTAEFGMADTQGYRKTHGWFVAIVQLPPDVKSKAEGFAEDELALHQQWVAAQQNQKKFPSRIVITTIVESDDAQPFQEGSRDAGPIAKKIVDWLLLP